MWNKRTLTLSVMPDFAIFSTAGYKIDVDHLSDTRYVYRYWLLNESPAEDPASRNIENLDEQVKKIFLVFTCYLTKEKTEVLLPLFRLWHIKTLIFL